ncbi:hypothetical protein QL285_022036 [Trifolium repens]|nr:hypothetical protein QL285_022036 [Trifolium repens]
MRVLKFNLRRNRRRNEHNIEIQRRITIAIGIENEQQQFTEKKEECGEEDRTEIEIGAVNGARSDAWQQIDQSIVGNSSFLPYFAVPLHPVRNTAECLLGCVYRQFLGTSYQGFKLRSQSHQGFHDFGTS